MFLKAFRCCSPEFFDEEIDKIYSIGFDLKYPTYVIDIAYRKARKTFYSDGIRVGFNFSNVLVLPYFNDFLNVT